MAARPMVRTFFLVAAVAATASSAQTVTLKYAFQDATTYRFNKDSCTATVRVTWTSTLINTPCSELQFWSTELECLDKPGATDKQYPSVSPADVIRKTGTTNTFNVVLAELPGFFYSDAGVVCGSDLIDRPHKICGGFDVNGTGVAGTCTRQHASSLALIYDTRPPVAPTIDEVLEQDGALTFKFSASSDTSVVHFDLRAQGETEYAEKGQLATTSGSSIRIGALVNGTTYDVRARAEDGAKNFSAPSEVVAATPRLTKGFWARYRDAGGTQTGGCTAVHGLPLLLAGGLWLLRRKRN